MKQKSFLTKILAVLLAAAFFTACPAHIVALATGNSQSDEYDGRGKAGGNRAKNQGT